MSGAVTFGHLPFEIRYHILRINTRAAFEKRKRHFEKLFNVIPRIEHDDDQVCVSTVRIQTPCNISQEIFISYYNNGQKDIFEVEFFKSINRHEYVSLNFVSQDRSVWDIDSYTTNTTLEIYNDPYEYGCYEIDNTNTDDESQSFEI